MVGVAGGAEKVARVRALGADVAVDYTEPGWPDRVRAALDGREPTLALDGVGGDLGRAALELLGGGGRIILFGWSSGGPTRLTHGGPLRTRHHRVGRARPADDEPPGRPAAARGGGARRGGRRASSCP